MSAIGPGDWVQYIGAGDDLLRSSSVWCVSAIGTPPGFYWCGYHGEFNCGQPWLQLHGAEMPPGFLGFCASAFRPLKGDESQPVETVSAPDEQTMEPA
ncbi:MAG: hypothetical protein P4L73_03525 [Caulobacteraceae bacterium]|nr:hypothetical protein [Caulobacteraceae bacterium]